MTTTHPAPEETRLPIDEEIDAVLNGERDFFADPYQADTDLLEQHFLYLAERDARRTVYGLMRAIRREQAAIDDRNAYLAMVQDQVQRANEGPERTVAFLTEQVTALAESLIPEGKKSVDLPGLGRIQWRKTPEAVQVEDDEAFIAWAKSEQGEPELVRTKEEVKRTEAKQYALVWFKETGELLPGTRYQDEVERGSASIQWSAI